MPQAAVGNEARKPSRPHRQLSPSAPTTPAPHATRPFARARLNSTPTYRYVAFGGSGRTLGGGGASSSAPPAPQQQPAGEWEGVDESKPTTSLQLRLYDGSRLVARFNHTHTLADVRRFVRASRPDMAAPYTLGTAFPPAPLTDEAATLEAAGLLNAVLIQRKA
jgi:UBX domain-containing protein 1